jgi:adenylate kinase
MKNLNSGKIITMFGPNGSGKTTHAKLLAEQFGFAHMSSGDLLREHVKTDHILQDSLNAGNLAPNEIVDKLVIGYIDKNISGGIIVDGYPRLIDQADRLLHRYGVGRIACSIIMRVGDDDVIGRMLSRGRGDDSLSSIKNRLQIFHNQTEKAYEHLAHSGVRSYEVDVNPPKDIVNAFIKNLIKKEGYNEQ